MYKQFDLKSLMIAAALIAGGLGATIQYQLQGLITFFSIVLLLLILFTSASVAMTSRGMVVIIGISGGVLAWCILRATFGSMTIGSYWYRGQLDEIGGWAAGILIGAWRALALFENRND